MDVSISADTAQNLESLPPHDLVPTLIRSEATGLHLNLGELWRYRELLYFLTLRDIKVRYKQTLLGVAWVLIQPLGTMLIFTLVFTRFVRVDTGGMSYPLFALSGLVLWLFFTNAITNSANSLVLNSHLITKVYLPRMYLPAATIGTGFVDLAISLTVLFVMAFFFGGRLTASLLMLPVFVLMIVVFALALGLLFAPVTVRFRDVRQALPFLIQIWMFASPVIYPISIVPAKWQWLLLINPIAPILEGFRASLTGRPFDWPHLGIAAAIVLATLIASLYLFRRAEDNFADVI